MDKVVQEVLDLIKNVELDDAIDVSGQHWCSIHPSMIPDEAQLSTKLNKPSFHWTDDKKHLICYLQVSINGESIKKDSESDNDSYFEITATKAGIYAFKGDQTPSNEAVLAFCRTNAFYNLYPYFREYFQSMSSRMGLEPITLPVIKPFTVEQIKVAIDTDSEKKDGET